MKNLLTTKHIVAILLLLLSVQGLTLFAQVGGVAINTNGDPPDQSAILDINSKNKGLLIPRLTEAERNSITNPAEGLQIFNTNTKCLNLYYYNAWYELCSGCSAPANLSAFTMTMDSVEAGEQVNLTATDLSGDYYFWTFSGANPGYYVGTSPWGVKFNSPPGWKNIFLSVTKNGCKSERRDSIYVKPIYNNTNSQQIFIAPQGITTVTLEAWGGNGGGNGGGGLGAHVKGDLIVNPGDTLYIYVGGSGAGFMGGGGYNGGGSGNGGGASDVRYGGNGLVNRVIVAGGGGGGGYATGIKGGDAGGLTGGDGMDYNGMIKGTGGSQTAGGTGGWGSGYSGQGGPGQDGSLGQGGNWGCYGGSWAGAGGGGYYGGGAGGCGDHNSWGGSGGGGSSYIGGVINGTMYPSANAGDGKVIITW